MTDCLSGTEFVLGRSRETFKRRPTARRFPGHGRERPSKTSSVHMRLDRIEREVKRVKSAQAFVSIETVSGGLLYVGIC